MTVIRCWIASSLRVGRPTIAGAAEAAGMSVRTLQRRLADSGYSYRQLLDEVRCEAACGLLERLEATPSQTALAVGYADAAHFNRAFKRWTGLTPTEFRKCSPQKDAK